MASLGGRAGSGGPYSHHIRRRDLAQESGRNLFPCSLSTLSQAWLGRSQYGADPYFDGVMDDVRIYDNVLSETLIRRVMTGKPAEWGMVLYPVPATGQKELARDLSLSWTAGDFANTHDVYLGTNFDDVNAATTANPKGVLVAQGLTQPSFNPGRLEFGKTYYWRVDEVNAPPTLTVFKGAVWNFATELLAYPITNVTVTASSFEPDYPPERVIDGSGLVNDLHATDPDTMWRTEGLDAASAWIQFDFDKVYELQQMVVWNYNSDFESLLGWGFRDVTVEYSADGTSWSRLGDFVFNQSPGRDDYASDIAVAFGGIPVRQVKLTVTSNWGGMGTFGLSEVRFLSIPAFARQPQPAPGATEVDPDAGLSWRRGREAASHRLFVGESQDAVATGTVPAVTLTQNQYVPATVELGKTYYWRVDEVNLAEAITTWPGDVWSFSTADYFVIDDCESYNDTTNAIFSTWIDGYGTTTNGAQVGYSQTPYAERTTRHGGLQSMPFAYQNTRLATLSEATRTFDSAQDWTRAGVKVLTLYFYGATTNSPGPLYVKVNSAKIVYSGSQQDLTKAAWTVWNVDLTAVPASTLRSVSSLTVGVGTAGSGSLLIDDIRLYRVAPTN
jgi:hypothetical protein